MELLNKFKQYIQKENLYKPQDRLLLAVSGGVDSVVMCELCKQAGYDFEIAHCNFQLRGEESNRDEQFVKALADKYSVVLHVKIFDTIAYAKEVKKSIEEAARDLRYEWFYSILSHNITGETNAATPATPKHILTAHHADDNVETVLINFFRGTGITGLRGILPRQGKIIRPLLFARRMEIETFAKENSLAFVTDSTNLENDYTRNYFRNTIIPLVNETFPAATKNVLNNIQRFRETEILYQQAIQVHRKKLITHKGDEIHIPVLKLLKTVPMATVLFDIIKDVGFTAHQTDEAIGLLNSETGRYIQSATHRIIKNRNWLIIAPIQITDASHIVIDAKDSDVVFKNGAISLEHFNQTQFVKNNDSKLAQVDLAQIKFPLILRRWRTGDYFYPLGMQKKKKLSRFFIDQKLSLTEKENAWVIEMDKKIIWVVGMRIDDRFKIHSGTKECLKIIYRPK